MEQELRMLNLPQPGQRLNITNSDYIVISEEWVVLTVEGTIITFSCKKWWDYNSITMQGQTSETVIGEIAKVDDKEVIVKFKQYSSIAVEVGLAIHGDQATYLKRIDPPAHA